LVRGVELLAEIDQRVFELDSEFLLERLFRCGRHPLDPVPAFTFLDRTAEAT